MAWRWRQYSSETLRPPTVGIAGHDLRAATLANERLPAAESTNPHSRASRAAICAPSAAAIQP